MARFPIPYVFAFFLEWLVCHSSVDRNTETDGEGARQASQPKAGAEQQRHIVPLHRQRTPVQSDDGIVSYKSVYFGDIYVGAPSPQKFSVVFDTGSGNVILPSVVCDSDTCKAHSRYDHELSGTARLVDFDGTEVSESEARDQVTVAFGTGEVTGEFAVDRLCLGVSPSQSLAHVEASSLDKRNAECVDMNLITASEMSDEPFGSFTFDGVLGLGLDSLALAAEFSFFGLMTSRSELAHASFGVFLADDDDDDFSEISFGGHNPERLESSVIDWAPVALPELGYWQVQITAIRVNNRTLDFCKDAQCRAVLDTGTSSIAAPGAIMGDLQDTLQSLLQTPLADADGSAHCAKAEGALLEFDVGGATLSLGPGDYARPSARPNSVGPTKVDAADSTEDARESDLGPLTECRPALLSIEMEEPLGPKLFIFGEPVLRKYYTIFDWQKQRIGFGLAAHTNDDENDSESAVAELAARGSLDATPLLVVT